MDEKATAEHVIHSELYGELRPEQHQIFHFGQGLVGFSHLNQFALLPYGESQLFILQSLHEEIGLLLLPATLSGNSEGFNIDAATVEELEAEYAEDIAAFYTLRFIDDQPYVNLKAPILITPSTQKGCQYVLHDDQVSLCERLIMAGDSHART